MRRNQAIKPSMVFYRCTATIKTTFQIKEFIIQTPDYEEQKIKDILLEVHPEYEDIKIRKIQKPAHVKAWGADDNT